MPKILLYTRRWHRQGSNPHHPPMPTVNPGQNVAEDHQGRGRNHGLGREIHQPFGDVFQLAIQNTTGAGNQRRSGLQRQGRGGRDLHLRKRGQDNTTFVSMAVPIKFGLDLMGSQRILK